MDELRSFVLSNSFNGNVMDEVISGLRKIVEEKGGSTDVVQQLKNMWMLKLDSAKTRDKPKTSRAKSEPKSAAVKLHDSYNSSAHSSSEDDSAVAGCSKNGSSDDETALGSDDDSFDAEQELLECEPTVVCQYDTVNRSGKTWNLQLRDGIMRVDGKDIAFQRATGDTKW